MSLYDYAAMHRANQATMHMLTRSPRPMIEKYLSGMVNRNELVPGADKVIADSAMKGGGTVLDVFARLGKILTSDGGKRYANPERVAPAEPEAPSRAVIARFGLGAAKTSELYAKHAADLASYSEANLPLGVFNLLHRPEYLDLLGGPREMERPTVHGLPAGATVAEKAAAWHAEREAAKQAQAEARDGPPPPPGPLDHHLAAVRGLI
jgi:hypothetical protein